MTRLKAGAVVSCVLFLLSLVVTGSSRAEIPKKINYQGRLTDSATGSPLVGPHDMTFRLYDDPGAGNLLWSESQTLPADSVGVFSAILGSSTAIDVSFDGPVWLEVEVGGEVLSPRREIVSVPFAFRAEKADQASQADSLGGYAADDFVREGETSVITSEMIIDGARSKLDADMVDGLNADAFADTSHDHDDRYYTQDSLSTPGMVNDGSNPVDWTKLKGIPGGLADGVDDVGGAGDGHSLDAADGDPVDAVYVDDEGNVGIGTSSPSKRLHLSGDSSAILVEAGTSDPEINLIGLGDDPSSVWKIYKDIGSGDLRFNQDGDRMRIMLGTGRVGIGAGTPSEQLDVDGNINLSEHLKINQMTVLSVEGDGNTFLGTSAGQDNSLGFDNVFVGDSAGFTNTEGYYNVFVSKSAGFATTEGSLNSFLGVGAGAANDWGISNTFIGAFAGAKTSAAVNNTVVGTAAGADNISGSENVYLGIRAGGYGGSGSRNTCLGSFTGLDGDGSGNVFVGHTAGKNETGSNKLYIANGPDPGDVLIYGDFSTGNLGLGTLAPGRKLHIVGNNPRVLIEASSSNPEINFKNSGDAAGEVWALYKDDTSRDLRFYRDGDKVTIDGFNDGVGIGTTEPKTTLGVVFNEDNSSDGDPNDDMTWGNNVQGLAINNLNTVTGSYVPLYFMHGSSSNDLETGAAITSELEFVTAGRAVSDMHFWVRNGDTPSMTSAMNIQRNGDVGIGTTTPYGRLHVVGNKIRLDGVGGTKNIEFRTDGAEVDIDVNNANLFLKSNTGNTIIQGFGGYVGTRTTSPGYALQVGNAGDGTQARANVWNTLSSREYKKGISPLTSSDYRRMLKKLADTEVVHYIFADDEAEVQHIGLIAEDAPREIVTQDGKALSLSDYSAFLLAAIKAQQDEIEALQAEVQELRSLMEGR